MVENNLRQLIRTNFSEWCLESSYYGISKIMMDKSKIKRLTWIIFFMGSLIGCFYLIIKCLIDYYDYKTSISLHHHQDSHTIFPAITICNMNPFNVELIGEYFSERPIGFNNYDECISREKTEWHNKCFQMNETNILNYYIRSFRGSIANEKKFFHNRTKYSLNLNGMLFNCLYNLSPCNAENFTEIWNNVFGNCYTFGNTSLKASGTGSFLGLMTEFVLCKFFLMLE